MAVKRQTRHDPNLNIWWFSNGNGNRKSAEEARRQIKRRHPRVKFLLGEQQTQRLASR